MSVNMHRIPAKPGDGKGRQYYIDTPPVNVLCEITYNRKPASSGISVRTRWCMLPIRLVSGAGSGLRYQRSAEASGWNGQRVKIFWTCLLRVKVGWEVSMLWRAHSNQMQRLLAMIRIVDVLAATSAVI